MLCVAGELDMFDQQVVKETTIILRPHAVFENTQFHLRRILNMCYQIHHCNTPLPLCIPSSLLPLLWRVFEPAGTWPPSFRLTSGIVTSLGLRRRERFIVMCRWLLCTWREFSSLKILSTSNILLTFHFLLPYWGFIFEFSPNFLASLSTQNF